MKIGVNSLCFKEYTIEEAARVMSEAGLDSVQLFLDFKNARIYPMYHTRAEIDSNQLNKEKFEEIFSIFEKAGIEIAVLGGHTNLVESDENLRIKNIENLRKLISLCRNLRTNIVATESGQLERVAQNHSLKSFARLVDSVKRLIPILEKKDVVLAVEAFWPDTLRNYAHVLKLIQKVDSDKVKVVIDPANVEDESITDILNYIGPYLAVAHVKRAYTRDEDLCRKFLSQLKEHQFSGSIILDIRSEDPGLEEVARAKNFLEKIADEVGL